MALESGTRVGIYEVTAKIGEGGMGEVYQARDTTLDRDVALKVLPEAFTADPDRLARFQREAKVLASLNHSNIGAIYGLEAAGETQALVLELIEGPTLADRIAEGPIPVDEALTIAKQIAEALEAAHEQGIIHRDLKPANVKVKSDGTVKVLDFGLAKAVASDAGGRSASTSATMSLTASATQMGMVIGTAAYMAPEQAKGKPVDKRADIWAFGVVLLEMLSGKRLFTGETASETLAAVMMQEPAWDRLPADLPTKLDNLLRRCLQKDPKERVRDIGDVRLAMQGAFETTIRVAEESTAVAPPQFWQRPVMAGAILGVTTLTVAAAMWVATRPAPPTPAPVNRFVVNTNAQGIFSPIGLTQNLHVSRDGQQIVYQSVADDLTTPQLAIRHAEQIEVVRLRGSERGRAPFMSPDGDWVGFLDFARRSIQKVSTFGGPPVMLVQAANLISGASWGEDDQIVFGTNGGGLSRVSGGGGESEPLTTLDTEEGDVGHMWPFVISEHDVVLFVITSGAPLQTGELAVLDLQTGETTRLGVAGVSPHYVSTGHIVYAAADASLRAVPFDVDSLEVVGSPVPLVEDISVGGSGSADFSISGDGDLVYAIGVAGGGLQRSFVWVDRSGNEEPIPAESANYAEFALSPDGNRVAVHVQESAGGTVRIYDLERDTSTRLTFEEDGVARWPIWTPDGERVAFWGSEVNWKASNGTGATEVLNQGTQQLPQAFSPDGSELVVLDLSNGGNLSVIDVAGGDSATVLLGEDYTERNASLSPDGKWLAYQSDETGEFQVYVRPFPNVQEGRWQVSSDGGVWPVWNPMGAELFYVGPTHLMALPFVEEEAFSPGPVGEVFAWNYATGLTRQIAVDLDGERFLALTAPINRSGENSPDLASLTVVLNWSEELRDRVPVP